MNQFMLIPKSMRSCIHESKEEVEDSEVEYRDCLRKEYRVDLKNPIRAYLQI